MSIRERWFLTFKERLDSSSIYVYLIGLTGHFQPAGSQSKESFLRVGKYGIGADTQRHKGQSNGMKGRCQVPVGCCKQHQSQAHAKGTAVFNRGKDFAVHNRCHNHGRNEFARPKDTALKGRKRPRMDV